MQVHAAAALSNLARGNEGTQMAISRAGGIGPLLAVVASRNSQAQAQGASAVAQLCRFNRENQDSVARSGGIPMLVQLLASHNPLEVRSLMSPIAPKSME